MAAGARGALGISAWCARQRDAAGSEARKDKHRSESL